MNSTKPILTVEINLNDELLTLNQARKLFPQFPSLTTIWRWRTNGVNSVKLPAMKSGNRWITTKPAILEFIRLQTIAVQAHVASEGRSEQTRRDLEAAGLLKPH